MLRNVLLRSPDWLLALAVAAATFCLTGIPQLLGTLFFYVGDMHESFAPNWHRLGSIFREGWFPLMESRGWAGGNYVGEAALGLFNPFQVLQFLLVSGFDSLQTTAYVVQAQYLAIVGAGVFMLAREYGARRAVAIAVGIAAPFVGFTLYYEASGWPAGLAAYAFVLHFWWSVRRFSREGRAAWRPFLFGFLAIATGNPYATLVILIVLLGVGVELVLAHEWRRMARTALLSLGIGCLAVAVILPLIGALPVSVRQSLAFIANDTFMVPDLGDLSLSSSPSYRPSITNWGGAVLEQLPSVYLAWFVVPLLPWLRWGRARVAAASSVSLVTTTAVLLVLVLGPSNLWLFRWPLRLIEYAYAGLLVGFALLLSAGLATSRARLRWGLSIGLVLYGAYGTWAVQPGSRLGVQAAALALTCVLVAMAILVATHGRDIVGLSAVLMAGVTAVLALQVLSFPEKLDPTSYLSPPTRVSQVKEQSSGFKGRVLQIASIAHQRADQPVGSIIFGNASAVGGYESLNRYTGIGQAAYLNALCMDYRGAVCPELYANLWGSPAGTDVDSPLVDLLGVDTLVLQKSFLPDVAAGDPPAGWESVEESEVRSVWVRRDSSPDVTWSSGGDRFLAEMVTPWRQVISRQSGEGDATVILPRVYWPGFTASTPDGSIVEVKQGPAGLVELSLRGDESQVAIVWAPPYWRLSVGLGATSLLFLLAAHSMWGETRVRGSEHERAAARESARPDSLGEEVP